MKATGLTTLILAAVLVFGSSTSWAAITDCGNGNPGNEICVATGNDKIGDIQTLITAHLNSGTTLDSLTLLTKSDDDGTESGIPAFSTFGTTTNTVFKNGTEPIGGTWDLGSNIVDFISIKAGNGFKIYNVMGASSGLWDTVGIGTFIGSPCEICGLSHISFWQSTSTVPTAVPIPAAALLFGSGLLGLIGIARRKGFITTN